jgi:mRNA interferase MazF
MPTTFSMNCSRHDVVLLPIPFTDLSSQKVRPAVVIGHGSFPGGLFVVPITSQLANTDFALNAWQAVGLNVPCGIKSQICTIEDRLVRKVVGKLHPSDVAALQTHLRNWLGL